MAIKGLDDEGALGPDDLLVFFKLNFGDWSGQRRWPCWKSFSKEWGYGDN